MAQNRGRRGCDWVSGRYKLWVVDVLEKGMSCLDGLLELGDCLNIVMGILND